MNYAIVIGGMSQFKIMKPIIEYMAFLGIPYYLFLYKGFSKKRAYNNLRENKINKVSKVILFSAKKVVWYKDFDRFCALIDKNKINKILSVEASNFSLQIKQIMPNLKIYSIGFFTDSCFGKKKAVNACDVIYHTTLRCMETLLQSYNMNFRPSRDKVFGSPMFDCIAEERPLEENIILFVPTLYKAEVNKVFYDEKTFVQVLRGFLKNPKVLIKSRRKQYLPKCIISEYKDRIHYDGNNIYPTKTSQLFGNSIASIMFYSSGIYEAIIGGQYIINCRINTGRWGRYKTGMSNYLTSIYTETDNLIKNVDPNDVKKDDFELPMQKVNFEKATQWIENNVMKDFDRESYKRIVDNFLI